MIDNNPIVYKNNIKKIIINIILMKMKVVKLLVIVVQVWMKN